MDRHGRVVIPKAIRHALSLRPGDTVVFEYAREMIVLGKAEIESESWNAALADTLSEWATPEDERAYRDL